MIEVAGIIDENLSVVPDFNQVTFKEIRVCVNCWSEKCIGCSLYPSLLKVNTEIELLGTNISFTEEEDEGLNILIRSMREWVIILRKQHKKPEGVKMKKWTTDQVGVLKHFQIIEDIEVFEDNSVSIRFLPDDKTKTFDDGGVQYSDGSFLETFIDQSGLVNLLVHPAEKSGKGVWLRFQMEEFKSVFSATLEACENETSPIEP